MKEPEQRSRVLLAGSLPSLSQPLLMAIPIRLHAQDERERQQLRRGEQRELERWPKLTLPLDARKRAKHEVLM